MLFQLILLSLMVGFSTPCTYTQEVENPLSRTIDSTSSASVDSVIDEGRPFAMFLDDEEFMEMQMVESSPAGFWDYMASIFQSDFFLGAITALLMLYAWENISALLLEKRNNRNKPRNVSDGKTNTTR